jgi:hypothetical protein
MFSSKSSPEYLKLRSESIQCTLQAMADYCVTKQNPLYCSPEIISSMGIDNLWRAASYDDLPHMNLLISFSWDVDRQTPFGATAAHFACAYSRSGAMSLLLKHKASLTLRDSFGHLPRQLPELPKLPIAYRLTHNSAAVKLLVVFNPFSGARLFACFSYSCSIHPHPPSRSPLRQQALENLLKSCRAL